MEEKKKEKKKLTLTISSKKTYDASSYTGNTKKTSFVIDKSYSRKKNEKRSYVPNRNENRSKSGFINRKKPKTDSKFFTKKSLTNNNFEIRKIAEERATKRFRNLEEGDLISKKGNINKSKSSSTKREYKLTLSKALTDDVMEARERSYKEHI